MKIEPRNDSTLTQIWNAFAHFTKTSVWPAYAGCVWALLYAVFIRFYQAAGGMIGLPGQIKSPGFYMASYIAGVLIMLCGFILLGLVKSWGRVIPSWVPLIGGLKIHRLILLIPTLLCSAFLIAHGAAGTITRSLFLAGIISLKLPLYSVVDIHLVALWDLLVYEPWFLIMGILSGLTAAHYAQATGDSLSALRRGTVIYLIFVFLVTAIFVSAIVFDFVEKISF